MVCRLENFFLKNFASYMFLYYQQWLVLGKIENLAEDHFAFYSISLCFFLFGMLVVCFSIRNVSRLLFSSGSLSSAF